MFQIQLGMKDDFGCSLFCQRHCSRRSAFRRRTTCSAAAPTRGPSSTSRSNPVPHGPFEPRRPLDPHQPSRIPPCPLPKPSLEFIGGAENPLPRGIFLHPFGGFSAHNFLPFVYSPTLKLKFGVPSTTATGASKCLIRDENGPVCPPSKGISQS